MSLPAKFPPKPKDRAAAQELLEETRKLRAMAAACLNSAQALDAEMSDGLAQATEWAREWGIDA